MRLSLVVMAYRQEAFIAETIAAAFAQDYPDLEIVLTDDASPDGTYRVMEEMAAAYRGPHRIVLNRNPQNLGLIGHVNRLFDLATSDWLIYNAGDDISEPHRARTIAEVIARDQPHYVYSNVTDLDAAGDQLARQKNRTRPEILQQKSLPDLAKAMSHALGASSAWHRDLFTRFGPIVETDLFEDQVLMFRARLIGTVS
jgi:glycosyltransferase involved in cell wall biosynthesis